MNLILFDDQSRGNFFPFTHTRPTADIRCGILTMRQRWEKIFGISKSSSLTHTSLVSVFPCQNTEDSIYVNGRILGQKELKEVIIDLIKGQCLLSKEGIVIAFKSNEDLSISFENISDITNKFSPVIYPNNIESLNEVWDIFSKNAAFIHVDFDLITQGRVSEKMPEGITVIAPENVFIAPNAKLMPCIINASEGSVYIDEDAEIMEGALIRGPFSLGKHACLKMGAKIYGGTTIGDGCKVGGEVNNAVFFNHSNKGHDGFIGNAVIGDWCNLGADTNCSNLKNNYDEVKIWQEHSGKMVSTGLQFCGLLMGDHSKCGINTMFNTGTVVGVSCNIFGAGFPDKYIPSFTWGGIHEHTDYHLDKAIETANRMMARRHLCLSESEISVLEYLFNQRQLK